jgi:hypothetical protein
MLLISLCDQPAIDRTPCDHVEGWPPMPCVWCSWACQLLAVDTSTTGIGLDLVALEPQRIRGANFAAGTSFSARAAGLTAWSTSDLDVVADWAGAGATVMLSAGPHGRSSWAALSRGDERVVLADVVCDLGQPAHHSAA